MKRRIVRLLLGFLYVCLVAALLLIHVQSITGAVQRVMATVETVFLAAFTALVLGLYLKTVSGKEQKNPAKEGNRPIPETYEAFAGRLAEICAGKPPEEILSPRETEVAWLLYRGYTNRQIGEELYIAETTVKKHASHIYEKLQVTGKKELRDKIMARHDSK